MSANSTFTTTVLDWFAENGRQLPWRDTGDAYAIWLSEIILQQTRVSQGTAYWHRFMHAFPTVESLASASEDEVLRLWQGLGYYSRARHLHAAARLIARRGAFPSTYQEIRQLPGVGSYTAAAVASMAFGLPYAAVDGNVYRVLARYYAIPTPIDTTAGRHEFQSLSDSLLPRDKAGAWNQAMMDFGATVCTPLSPRCVDCPLMDSCRALRSGCVASLPARAGRTVRRDRHFTYLYLRRDGQVAIHRRGRGDIWQGLYEPLLIEESAPFGETCGTVLRHILTHQRLFARMIVADYDGRPLPPDYFWIDESQWHQYALPRLVERLLETELRTKNPVFPEQ